MKCFNCGEETTVETEDGYACLWCDHQSIDAEWSAS